MEGDHNTTFFHCNDIWLGSQMLIELYTPDLDGIHCTRLLPFYIFFFCVAGRYDQQNHRCWRDKCPRESVQILGSGSCTKQMKDQKVPGLEGLQEC